MSSTLTTQAPAHGDPVAHRATPRSFRFPALLAIVMTVLVAAGALNLSVASRADAGEWRWNGYAFNSWETAELAKWEPGSTQPGHYLQHIANFPILGGWLTWISDSYMYLVKWTASFARSGGKCVRVNWYGGLAIISCPAR